MITGIFGGVDGSGNAHWIGGQAVAQAHYMLGLAAQNAACNTQNMAYMQNLTSIAYPVRKLEPGIFWTKTGGKTHRVVIRREPEYEQDLSGLLNAYRNA